MRRRRKKKDVGDVRKGMKRVCHERYCDREGRQRVRMLKGMRVCN